MGKNIRDSDGRSSGCRIVVLKERECGFGTPTPNSIPLLDTGQPMALKRKRVTHINDQLKFNRYDLLAFRGYLLYLADLHVREIPEIRKNLDVY